MKSRELNILLIKNIPGLKPLYEAEVVWQEGDDTGSHVVFEDVLIPYIINSAKKKDTGELKKCFEFIEKLLCNNDEYVNEVVEFSVLEDLAYQESVSFDFEAYMKKKTIEVFKQFRTS